jgi:serine/threonine-protein kinase
MPDVFDRLKEALSDRYTIEREIGSGGMATVYLAEDLKHHRPVALKVLRPELAAVLGADRFVQEITTTANLQHPHILPLHDSGDADGFLYYVMPFIDGETLRDKLNRETQLGIDEAVGITRDIADALDYAHRHNVIHRDIKPENILLHDGRPTVADFGIALAVSAAAGGRITETGLSLGTPHYMSPEQATAQKDLTNRSDIYSLGSVLYEMLTGEPPHTGASPQAIIMKIVTEAAQPVTELRKSVPPHVAAATVKSLEKLAADRFESAAKFAEALTNPAFTLPTASGKVVAGAAASGLWKRLSIGLAVVAALLLLTTVWAIFRPQSPDPVIRHRTVLWDEVPAAIGLAPVAFGTAIAPDGSAIVYVDVIGGQLQLFLKPENEVVPIPLAGTEGGTTPFFSPDGSWIGFVADGKLRKVPRGGGGTITLADSAGQFGGAWLDDGTIVFSGITLDLRRVNEVGGDAEVFVSPAADLSGRAAAQPSPLPDARGVLFTACTSNFLCDVRVYDARADTVRLLFEEAMGIWYVPTGHVVYSRSVGGLFAAPFDLSSLEVTGAAIPVLEGVQAAGLAFSHEGTALYMLGDAVGSAGYEVVWVDRSGRATPVHSGWTFRPGGSDWGMALSPNQERLALKMETDLGNDVWIKLLPDGPLTRFTFNDGEDRMPRWAVDGQYVTFISVRGGNLDLYRRRADHTGDAELLLDYERSLAQGFYSPNGEWVVLRTGGAAGVRGGRDILGFRPDVDTIPVPLVVTESDEQAPAVSPDGRWLAYLSDETGRNEVYVCPFPDTDRGKWQVSEGGATAPLWAHSGTELFYVSADRDMMVAEIQTGPPFSVGQRRVLFRVDAQYLMGVVTGYYDIAADDQRFLMRRLTSGKEDEVGEPNRLVLVQSWFEELKEKLGN